MQVAKPIALERPPPVLVDVISAWERFFVLPTLIYRDANNAINSEQSGLVCCAFNCFERFQEIFLKFFVLGVDFY